jgi:hypothetical protein
VIHSSETFPLILKLKSFSDSGGVLQRNFPHQSFETLINWQSNRNFTTPGLKQRKFYPKVHQRKINWMDQLWTDFLFFFHIINWDNLESQLELFFGEAFRLSFLIEETFPTRQIQSGKIPLCFLLKHRRAVITIVSLPRSVTSIIIRRQYPVFVAGIFHFLHFFLVLIKWDMMII